MVSDWFKMVATATWSWQSCYNSVSVTHMVIISGLVVDEDYFQFITWAATDCICLKMFLVNVGINSACKIFIGQT